MEEGEGDIKTKETSSERKTATKGLKRGQKPRGENRPRRGRHEEKTGRQAEDVRLTAMKEGLIT